MNYNVEKTFSISASKLAKANENYRSAKTKLNWGIALLVIGQIIDWIIILCIMGEPHSFYYYSSSATSILWWAFVVLILIIVGTILLIGGIVNSVRCGRIVNAMSKCKLHVSSKTNSIYGWAYNPIACKANDFSVALQQITRMTFSGDTLVICAGRQTIRLNYLSAPYDAMEAINQLCKLSGMPAIPTNLRDHTAPQSAVQANLPQPMSVNTSLQMQQTAPQTKFCTECGRQIPSTSRFCPKCGSEQDNT